MGWLRPPRGPGHVSPWARIFICPSPQCDLPIEYKLTLSTNLPIDSLTDNIVERLKFSLVERSFNNRIYERNPQNSNCFYLPFDGDQRLIAG